MTTLRQIQQRIVRCTQCPRLVAYRRQVARDKVRRFQQQSYWGKPVPSFGDPCARLLIIGLAPAAHGGNRTGRAFTGDRSGAWLYEALYTYGFATQPDSAHRRDTLQLHDCFITQVLHCAPPANTPTSEEISNCRVHMLAELQALTHIQVVVPLGKIAFDAYLRVSQSLGYSLPTPRPRFTHGQPVQLPQGLLLLPSYHPSQQNTQTGRLTRAMFHDVFAAVRSIIDHRTSTRPQLK